MEITIGKTNVQLIKDYAILQPVDLVFNSASGLLFMRTGTAKKIRDVSEDIDGEEYYSLLDSFDDPVMKKYIETFDVASWKPKQAQLSSFKKIIANKGPFVTGEIVLDKEWSETESKHVLHIVGTTYRLENEVKMEEVTEPSLTKTLTKAFQFANDNGYESISTPVLCTRGEYGLHPSLSLKAILRAIKNVDNNTIKKVIVCFESKGPQEFFNTITEEELIELLT